MNEQNSSPTDVLRNISAQEFLSFGLHEVAYIRPVRQEGVIMWSLHAADGTALAVQPHPHHAAVLARQNGMEPITLN
jgi:hypothetical protein